VTIIYDNRMNIHRTKSTACTLIISRNYDQVLPEKRLDLPECSPTSGRTETWLARVRWEAIEAATHRPRGNPSSLSLARARKQSRRNWLLYRCSGQHKATQAKH